MLESNLQFFKIVWIFRQAGRHLPEYNEYKRTKGKNFLELLNDPVDVAECTMQPIRRYNLDAAILFSDILVILQALGIDVQMPGGVGITVTNPLVDVSDFNSRLPKSIDVREKLSHVIDAVKLIKKELNGKVPLIGFSAAPWTLMYYLVGGSSRKNQKVASTWLAEHPQESTELLQLLTKIVVDYLSAQVESGADMIQVFEAMGEFISEKDFYQWALPSMKQIASELKSKYPDVPLLVFPRGACYSIASLQEAGYDVVSIDTMTDRRSARRTLESHSNGKVSCIQGNLDVKLLQREFSDEDKLEKETQRMLEELGPAKLIANLGEGLTGKEDPILVARFIDTVHAVSEKMLSKTSK